MSRRRALLITVALTIGSALALPALASACTDTPVLSQACQAGQAGLGAAGSIGGNTVAGPFNGAKDVITGGVGEAAKNVVGAVTQPIFDQIATVTTDAATWLIGKVTDLINTTTSPNLMSRGFVTQYAQMAGIAAFLAAAMLLLAVIEGLARGDIGMLARVVAVNLPLAFIATSSAYIVVQLLLGVTDQISHAVAQSTGSNTHHFLHGATEGLSKAGAAGGASGGPVGASTGAVGAPVFAVIIAALLSIVAGFFLWIELAMRDAAVYVVALFLPMALAASIWPRWTGALRRTGELLVALIASKLVIVSIIALAAGLLARNEGRFEHVIAAAALLLLACFAPLVLIRLVPFAEGAMAGAYARRSSAGMALSGLQLVSSAQMMRATTQANWGKASAGRGLAMRPLPGAGNAGSAAGGAEVGAAAAGGGAAAAATAPVEGSRAAAAYLASTATASSATDREDVPPTPPTDEGHPRPKPEEAPRDSAAGRPPPPGESPPRPPGGTGGEGESGGGT